MKYKSRIDAYNYIMMAIMVVVMALPNFVFNFSWFYLTFMVVFDVVVIGQTFTTSYTFGEEELEVRSGFFKFRIYYSRILRATKIINLIDGAYSTAHKSVRIEFGDKASPNPYKVDISPEKEDEFLNELKKHCENIKEIENKRK